MENPILVEVYRGSVLESFHRGVICIVGEHNNVIFSAGNIQQICYPRSAMKFFQVLPLLQMNGMQHFGFTLEEIALMCGSHNAETEHLQILKSILKKIGCSASNLQCGPQYPTSKKDSDALILDHKKPGPEHNNCSGKHAGMLALAKLINADLNDYLNPAHPVQQRIKQTVSAFYEVDEASMEVALDGCSAPIFSIPVINQAIGFKNLTTCTSSLEPYQSACQTVIEAVSKYPFMVAGSKRYCTDMMKITAPKIIGKTGAEGMFCMSFTDRKWGVCIKIDDGKMLPQYNVAQALIEAVGDFDATALSSLKHYEHEALLNFNKFITGRIQTRPGLFDPIKAHEQL